MAPKARKALKDLLSPGSKRRLKRGFGSSFNDALVANLTEDLSTLDDDAKARYAYVAKWFEQCADTLKGVTINGKKCMEWSEAIDPAVGVWPLQAFKVVIGYYALKAKPADKSYKRIDIQTLESFAYRVVAAHNFWRNSVTTPELRKKLKLIVDEYAQKYSLRKSKFVRASLTPASVYALAKQATKLQIPIRRVLSILLYQATASSTGYRAGSMTRHVGKRAINDSRKGIRYSDYTLWAVSGEGGMNKIIVWITPRVFKNTLALGSSAPLMDNGKLSVCANILFLIAADVDGVLGDLTAEEILDPIFLDGSKAPKRVVFDEDASSQFVMSSNIGGKAMSTSDVGRCLRFLSRSLGFELDVRTHDYRHLVAAAVYHEFDYETAGQVMQHRFGGNVTTRYFGHQLPFVASLALFGKALRKEDSWHMTRRTAVPNDDAPSALNSAELNQVLDQPQLVAIREKQQVLQTEIAKNFGTIKSAPENVAAEFRQLGRQWQKAFVLAIELAFRQTRAEWFSNKRQRVFADPKRNDSKDRGQEAGVESKGEEKTEDAEQGEGDPGRNQEGSASAAMEIEIMLIEDILRQNALPEADITPDQAPLPTANSLFALFETPNRSKFSDLIDEEASKDTVTATLALFRSILEAESSRGSVDWAAARRRRKAGTITRRAKSKLQEEDELEAEEEEGDDDELSEMSDTDGDEAEMSDVDSADEDEEAQHFWADS